jgi:NRPS condensation-like uncharacterized protein
MNISYNENISIRLNISLRPFLKPTDTAVSNLSAF